MKFERTALVLFDEHNQIRNGVIFWNHVVNDAMGLSDSANLYFNWDYAAYLAVL